MRRVFTTTAIAAGFLLAALCLGSFVPQSGSASAATATPCTFTTSGTTMTLDGDCTTDSTISIPDGFTLDGAGHMITAIDPTAGHFVGAVVQNGGTTAHVKNLTVTASGLANVCDGGTARLRGIMFEGASGSITKSDVIGINQGASGCQEGNAIEVRNEPFDGTHPNTQTVEIAHNNIQAYQKTGIVSNGDVSVNIHHNTIGGSATQANLAANSVQLGFGATGSVTQNHIDGNSWCCADAAATAVLLFDSQNAVVDNNNIGGNADVGIYIEGSGSKVNNNRVFESGADGFYDIGVGDYGTGSSVTNNKVRGYEIPYDGVTGGKNKIIPGSQKFQ
ncbi:MAG TPA: right-handed parallel beta-helix repeat-containing protein [Pyrinomonadaceae bacterium]|nr:right-handed parallel beta-helix repeat-containing protein [Pyrinomonadaceae bacterium]